MNLPKQPEQTTRGDAGCESADAVICGAGVAGLTLATLLAQSDRRIVVLEARSHQMLEREGLFLTLAPNGMNALRAINAHEAVAAAGVDTTGIEFRDERGGHLASVDQSDHAEKLGAPSVTITRSRLFALLLAAALRAGVDVRFSEPLTTLVVNDDTVKVETASGVRLETPLLCACDGLRSTARRLAFPQLPQPHFTGLVGAGGLVEADDVEPTGGVIRMTFGREAFFGYVRPADGPVYWFNSFSSRDPDALPSDGRAGAVRLRELHAQDPADNRRVLAAVSETDRFYPIFDMPELPAWHDGRVVLVGDAAHAVGPHAGQGASMAIEDAVVLAACLDSADSPTEALRLYEALRRPRIGKVVRATAHNGSQKKASGWLALALRNLILRLALPFGARMLRRIEQVRIDLAPLVPPT